jgi:hypothetical protein
MIPTSSRGEYIYIYGRGWRVRTMADGKFFATQGGPIVLVQVENELPSTDKSCE